MSSTVKTAYIYPPIPIRCFDWCAWIDGATKRRVHTVTARPRQALADLACTADELDRDRFPLADDWYAEVTGEIVRRAA
jgi:hypothetical protein